jgi:hypothetical protein
MKQTIAILAFSLFAVSAHAVLPQVPQAALCEIELSYDQTPMTNLEQTSQLDIKEVQSLSPQIVSFINQHLQIEQYTTADLDFAAIQKLFTRGGELAYNDLYVIAYNSKSDGATYTEIKSYPGDNPYSLFFDAAGKVVARSEDGSIGLKIGTETVYCWSASQESK